MIPAGLDDSKKDIVVYENASALIDVDGKPEQLLLGSLVQVNDGWRLVGAPRAGASGPELANVFSVPTAATGGGAAGAPSEKVQAWMAELDKLDRQAAGGLKPAEAAKLTDRRVAVLEKLASSATNREEAVAWYQQLAGLLNAAVQSEGYKAGVAKLASLERSPGVQRLGKDMEAHIRYQRIAAEQGLAFQNPKADFAKVQAKWVADLEKFVDAYPTSPDAADALLAARQHGGRDGRRDQGRREVVQPRRGRVPQRGRGQEGRRRVTTPQARSARRCR